VGWLNPGWQPNHEDRGVVRGGVGRWHRLIPTSRKPEAGGKGGEARHRSGKNQIGGVGEVEGSPTRLSAAARIKRGGAPMRGQRSIR
jgi:hypothetical protein